MNVHFEGVIKSINILIFLTLSFATNSIEGRWHLVGYEENVMYQFEDNYRYSIYSLDGTFGGLEDAGGSPNPYIVEDDIITIDLFFGTIVTYQMNFMCEGQVVEFENIDYGVIHSKHFREGYSYEESPCNDSNIIECEDLNQLDCDINNDCTWAVNEYTITCDDYDEEFLCDEYSGCNWHCCGVMWGGQCLGAGYCCDGGVYEAYDAYCSEVSSLIGDVNNDDAQDILDIIILVDFILNPSEVELDGADVNNDAEINVLDVVELVNLILNL